MYDTCTYYKANKKIEYFQVSDSQNTIVYEQTTPEYQVFLSNKKMWK